MIPSISEGDKGGGDKTFFFSKIIYFAAGLLSDFLIRLI